MKNTDRVGLFYVTTIGLGHFPTEWKILSDAKSAFDRDVKSGSYMRVTLFDCTISPVGVILCEHERGRQ